MPGKTNFQPKSSLKAFHTKDEKEKEEEEEEDDNDNNNNNNNNTDKEKLISNLRVS